MRDKKMDINVKTQLTSDDLIRSGACFDGVETWREKYADRLTVISTDDALKTKDGMDYIVVAANLDGDGYGGYGYGGYGGYGKGDGYGGYGKGEE